MDKKDHLFELIKALSKSEKRYFKLFAGIHGGQNTYMLLFEALDKMNTYDEDKIKKKFRNEKFVKQLSVTKNYLFNLIIRSLKQYDSNNDSFAEKLEEAWQTFQILKRRNLPNLADKYLKKVRKTVFNGNHDSLAIQVAKNDWEQSIKLPPGKMVQESEEKMELLFDHLDRQRNFYELTRLWHRYHTLIVYGQVARNEEDADKMRAIVNDPLMQDERLILSDRAQKIKEVTIVGAYEYLGEFEKAYELDTVFTNQILNTKHPDGALPPLGYMVAIRNYLQSCFNVKNWTQFERYLEKMNEIPRDSEELRVHFISMYDTQKLIMLVHSGRHEEALEFCERIQDKIDKYSAQLRSDSLFTMQLYKAITKFYLEKYNDALEDLNELILDGKYKKFPFMLSNARLLRLLCYYELGLREFMMFEVKSYYKFLYQQEKAYAFEFLILRMMKDVFKTFTKKEMYKVLENYRPKVQELKQNIYEKNAFSLFDYEVWMASKIDNKTMPLIVQDVMTKSA